MLIDKITRPNIICREENLFFFRFQEFLSGHVASYSAPAGARATDELFRSPDDDEEDRVSSTVTGGSESMHVAPQTVKEVSNRIAQKEITAANRAPLPSASKSPYVSQDRVAQSPAALEIRGIEIASKVLNSSSSVLSGEMVEPPSSMNTEVVSMSTSREDGNWSDFAGPAAAQAAVVSSKADTSAQVDFNSIAVEKDIIDAHNQAATIATDTDEDAAKKEFDRLFETNTHNTL